MKDLWQGQLEPLSRLYWKLYCMREFPDWVDNEM